MNSSELCLGERFQVGRDRGTIKYLGILDVIDTKQEWVGVDWDIPSRGKHDGVVKSKRFFQAFYKTSGSFIKLHKFKSKYNKKILSVLEAVKQRYIDENVQFLNNTGFLEDEEELIDGRKPKITIELVGMDEVAKKLSDLKSLTKVSLPGRFVQKIDTNLGNALPQLKEMDLSQTLIFSFTNHVLPLVRQLENLEVLNISENFFTFEKQEISDLLISSERFENIRILIANRCRLKFSEILLMTIFFPNLRELHCCGNDLETLEIHGDFEDLKKFRILENLESLHLATNRLSKFDEFSGISILPKLQILNINNNNISSIPREFIKQECFSKLEHLAVGNNKLVDLETSIDIFSSWKSLISLVCFGNKELENSVHLYCNISSTTSEIPEFTGNVVIKDEEFKNKEKKNQDILRMFVISKIKNLEILNRSEITKSEREDFEKYFLKKFYYEVVNIYEKTNINRLRMDELSEKYPGFVDPSLNLEDIKKGEKYKERKRISIVPALLVLESSEKSKSKSKKKRLKLSMTILQLKVLVKKIFRIQKDIDEIKLFFYEEVKGGEKEEDENKEKEKVMVIMDDNDLQLESYGIEVFEDEKNKVFEVFVAIKDLEKEKLEKIRKEDEFKKSLEKQEHRIYKQLQYQKKNQYY